MKKFAILDSTGKTRNYLFGNSEEEVLAEAAKRWGSKNWFRRGGITIQNLGDATLEQADGRLFAPPNLNRRKKKQVVWETDEEAAEEIRRMKDGD